MIYEKYAQLRDVRGITDYRVSKDTGISTSVLSGWKTGQREPSLKTVSRLARYFNVPIEYFGQPDGTDGAPAAAATAHMAPEPLSSRSLHMAFAYEHADPYTQTIVDRVLAHQ